MTANALKNKQVIAQQAWYCNGGESDEKLMRRNAAKPASLTKLPGAPLLRHYATPPPRSAVMLLPTPNDHHLCVLGYTLVLNPDLLVWLVKALHPFPLWINVHGSRGSYPQVNRISLIGKSRYPPPANRFFFS